MLGRSLWQRINVVGSGLPEVMLKLNTNSVLLANRPRERRLRLAEAATDRDCAAPAQPETEHESR